jgi:hypothetical protein
MSAIRSLVHLTTIVCLPLLSHPGSGQASESSGNAEIEHTEVDRLIAEVRPQQSGPWRSHDDAGSDVSGRMAGPDPSPGPPQPQVPPPPHGADGRLANVLSAMETEIGIRATQLDFKLTPRQLEKVAALEVRLAPLQGEAETPFGPPPGGLGPRHMAGPDGPRGSLPPLHAR